MENIAPAIEELRRAFDELKPLFDTAKETIWWARYDRGGALPMPVITIQSRGKRKTHGWYKPNTWKSESNDVINILVGKEDLITSMDEICIAAEGLHRSDHEILTTLTHAMIHHFNHYCDKTDKNLNGYHNSFFATVAQQIGFKVERDGSRGYYELEPRDRLTKAFDAIKLNMDVFDLFRKSEVEPEVTGQLNKSKKWTCGKGNISIRTAKFVVITCDECGQHFEYSDKDKDTPQRKSWLRWAQVTWEGRHAGKQAPFNYKNYRP